MKRKQVRNPKVSVVLLFSKPQHVILFLRIIYICVMKNIITYQEDYQ